MSNLCDRNQLAGETDSKRTRTKSKSDQLILDATCGTAEKELSHQVVELSTGNGEIICQSLGQKGYKFTLIHDTNSRYSQNVKGPCFQIRMHPRNSEFVVKRIADVSHIPPEVIQECFVAAFNFIGVAPENIPVNTGNGIFDNEQIGDIASLGFDQLRQGDKVYEPPAANDQEIYKQAEWNADFLAVRELLARTVRGETLEIGEKSHYEWCRSASMLLQMAMLEELDKKSLDSAQDIFELSRLCFIYAEKTLPVNTWEVEELDLLTEIEFAGCLARLAACSNLDDFNEAGSTTLKATKGRSRRDILFEKSIAMYEHAEERLPLDAPIELVFLVTSGMAHAYTLHGRFELEQPTLGEEKFSLDREERTCFQKALIELQELEEKTPPGEISEKVKQQITDTHNYRFGDMLLNSAGVTADKELLKLTREVLGVA